MSFETDFVCTHKDLKKANRAKLLATIKSNWLISILIFIGIPTITYGPGLIEGDKATIFTWVTAPFLMIFLYFLVIDVVTKMQFNKNKTTGNLNIHFIFHDDEFEMQTSLIKNAIRYDALHSIDENKDFFFIKLSSSKMVVVQKYNCSPELISFLQEKAVAIKSREKN